MQNPGLEPRTVPPPPAVPAGAGVARPTNSMAIVSLVAGIVGYVLPHPFIAGVIAVLAGHVARRQIRETGEGGAGLALAGLILGYVHLALSVVVLVFVVLLLLGVFGAVLGSLHH